MLSWYLGRFHIHSTQSLISVDMVKFPFTILAPIPKLNQVFLSPFYSGSNPFVMLIGCTGINFKQIISSCPNKISRITEFLVHVISGWSEFPLVWDICGPHQPQHTPAAAHPHSRNTHSASLTGRCHKLSDLLQLTFGCQRVNTWASALQVMWQLTNDKKYVGLFSIKWLEGTSELFLDFSVKVNI